MAGFLNDFKKAAKLGMSFELRPENIETITELGLTVSDCKNEILSLTVEEYSSGPTREKGQLEEAWIFGRHIQKEVYIKLLVVERRGGAKAWCLSFHFPDYPLQYPLRTMGIAQY